VRSITRIDRGWAIPDLTDRGDEPLPQTGAIAMGVPEFAACAASLKRVRIVLMLIISMLCGAGETQDTEATLIVKLLSCPRGWKSALQVNAGGTDHARQVFCLPSPGRAQRTITDLGPARYVHLGIGGASCHDTMSSGAS
jgi:hypothetical protein